jgi:(2Fe-2S) ferredoxin
MTERSGEDARNMLGATEILVCVNIDCKNRGADAVLSALKQKLAETGSETVTVKRYLCFSACNNGPNMVIPAKRCWLSGVKPADVDAVLAYVEGGPDLPQLRQNNDPDLEQLIFEIIDAGFAPEVD